MAEDKRLGGLLGAVQSRNQSAQPMSYGGLLGQARLGGEAEQIERMGAGSNYLINGMNIYDMSERDLNSLPNFLKFGAMLARGDISSPMGGPGMFWARVAQRGFGMPEPGAMRPGQMADPSAYPQLYDYAQGLDPNMNMEGLSDEDLRLIRLAQQVGYYTPNGM